MSTDRDLQRAGLVLIAGFVVHNADHARRGIAATSEPVVWIGTFALVVVAVMLTLVFTGHGLAPFAATAVGFAVAAGVAAVHLLPSWGPLSDSLPSGNVDALTWVAVMAEIAAATFMGWTGLRILRAQNFETQPRGTERATT